MTYTIKVGRYTIVSEFAGLQITCEDDWVSREQGQHEAMVAMAERIEELEVAIKAVLDGEIDERGVRGCLKLGMEHYGYNSVPLHQWKNTLRCVLEQKP